MATYGRKEEVGDFLESIINQRYNLDEVEIIIVDQNDVITLDEVCSKYIGLLNIKLIRSDKKGLSLNRNIGLHIAIGKYIAFPDDDCTYYPETLLNVENYFETNWNVDVVLGRIYDRKLNKDIIRNWKSREYKVNISNFYFSYSSITIFTKKNNILFDEKLGVGTFFGSYEDADYILQLIENNKKIIYTPDVEVWHPDLTANPMSDEKVYSYGLGFGALVKKHLSLPILYLFIQAIGFHLIKMIFGIFTMDKTTIIKRFLSIKSRLQGFYLYISK
jgi:glycosyltransferase involved in cell wall biosynthesis